MRYESSCLCKKNVECLIVLFCISGSSSKRRLKRGICKKLHKRHGICVLNDTKSGFKFSCQEKFKNKTIRSKCLRFVVGF